MIAWLLCKIGLHAWWYDHPASKREHAIWIAKQYAGDLVRVCATCPAKQRRIRGQWRREARA